MRSRVHSESAATACGRSPRARGRPLDARRSIAGAGLRHGDEVLLSRDGPPSALRRPAAGLFELTVIGGPAAGRRVPLGADGLTVGREHADVAIDDPSLSGTHLRVRADEQGGVTLEDLGSRNGTTVEASGWPRARRTRSSQARSSRRAAPCSRSRRRRPTRTRSRVDPDGSVPFNRQPRVQRPLTEMVFPLPAPPADPYRARIPFGASLVPLALGIGLYLVTRFPMMLMFAALSPVMAVSTYIEDRRSGRRAFAKNSQEFRDRLGRLRDELERERERELRTRRESAPAAPDVLRRTRTHGAALWERRPADPDFLSLRLGSGEQRSTLAVRVEPGGSEALSGEACAEAVQGPQELIEEYEHERTELIFEPGDLEDATEPETVVEAAEYFLLESDTNRDMWADLDASASFGLHQRKGTTVLDVVEVSQAGDTVTYRSSDGRHGATAGQRIVG